MITLNVVEFLVAMAVALAFGAFVSVHIYGCNAEQDGRVDRFRRDVVVNGEADMGEQR